MKEKKQIQRYETFEETLINCERYLLIVTNRFGIDDHTEDLQQIARLAVHEAHTNYNKDLGYTFHSYVISLMRGRMLNYINNNVKVIRIPGCQVNKTHPNHNPNHPTNIPTVSTSTPLSEDSTITIGDMLISSEEDNDIDDTELMHRKLIIKYLDELTPRYQRIIIARYIEDMSLKDIGDEFGVSKENIRQQIQKAMNQLQDKFGTPRTKIKEFKIFNYNK